MNPEIGTEISEDAMRQAFRKRQECLEPDQLESRMGLPFNDPQRLATAAHMTTCPRCTAQMALLEDFRHAEPRGLEQGVVRYVAGKLGNAPPAATLPPAAAALRSRTFLGIGAAAAILLAAVSLRGPVVRVPAAAESSETGVYRSAAMRGLAPDGELSAAPAQFRWTGVSGAAAYLLQVMEADRTVVYQHEEKAVEAGMPHEVSALLLRGKPLLWKVTALDGGGQPIQESTILRFHIKDQ